MDPVETAIRVACCQPDHPHALAVLDSALRAGVPKAELIAFASTVGCNGIVVVRQLLLWADGAAESPGESWLRWVILDAGLPAPTLQHWVSAGGRFYRLDLAWPGRKIACEYDGVSFHTGDRLFQDRSRLNALTAQGWIVVQVTAGRCSADDQRWSVS